MPLRIAPHQRNIQPRIVLKQTPGQRFSRLRTDVVQRQRADARRRQRSGNSRANAAAAHHQRPRPSRLETFTFNTEDKAFAVKHIAAQRTVGFGTNRVARPRYRRRRAQTLHQPAGGDFVRHGDQRANNIGHLKQHRHKGGIILRLHAHRHHFGVNLLMNQPRVVNHRRFKLRGRIAKMRYQPRISTNHHSLLLLLLRYCATAKVRYV